MLYYITNSSTNKTVVCKDLANLVSWFARFNYRGWGAERNRNYAFDNLAMNPNDTKNAQHVWDSDAPGTIKVIEYGFECRIIPGGKRQITVTDEDGRVIDPRIYKEWIFSSFGVRPWYKENKKVIHKEYGDRYYGNHPWEVYGFRCGPVPNVGHRYHYGNYLRHPSTTQERRHAADTEIKAYVRSSRSYHNLPDTYDDIPRADCGKSWKNKKLGKQWMKHISNHSDAISNEGMAKDTETYEDVIK